MSSQPHRGETTSETIERGVKVAVLPVFGRWQAVVRRWPDGTVTLVGQNVSRWLDEQESSARSAAPEPSHDRHPHSRAGLTLLELVVVLMITVALAGVMVPLVSDHVSDATEDATKATLAAIRNAVTLFWQDDDRSPKQVPMIHDLFVDPTTGTTVFRFDPTYKLGWRGPYLREATGTYTIGSPNASFSATYGNNGDRTLLDAWGRPVVIQNPGVVNGLQDVRVVSAGPDGEIDIAPVTFSSALNDSNDGDDVYVAFTLR